MSIIQAEIEDADFQKKEEGEVISTQAIQLEREFAQLVEQAQKSKRSVTRFRNDAKTLCTQDEDVASECMYALRRGGKTIEGPSARMAEILVYAWKNCRASSRIVAEDYRFVTAEGVFIDLEANVGIRVEVKRRITDKDGKRYGDDMIGTTSNAACSIAMRNAVLKGIPKAFWNGAYAEARSTAVGDQKTLASRRASMLDAFAKQGVTQEQVLNHVGRAGVDDIDLNDLSVMIGVFNGIKSGELRIDEAFGPKPEKKQSPVDAMKEKGKAAAKVPKSDPNGPMTPEEEADILRQERAGN